MPYYPIVLVEWHDACGDASEQWHEGGEVDHNPLVVKTLGYLMRDDPKGVTLWQEMVGEDGTSYRARSFIPRAMVQKVTYLQRKATKKPPSI